MFGLILGNPMSDGDEDAMNDMIEHNILGRSAAIQQVIKTIRVQSKYPTPVLISGETGTGKELAARGLHYSGPFASMPFIPLNCSTFNDELFTSELFGYKKGAFTDAKKDQVGLLTAAEGGSLFLDEIDSLSLKSQAALLRVIQEKEYRPIGSNEIKKTNVRLITATNRDLPKLIEEGKFREDLYYRLLILTLEMPPLRSRPEDIHLLVDHFIHKLNQQYELDVQGMSEQALERLYQHDWPGNVRELENTIHRLYLTCESSEISQVDIPGVELAKKDNSVHPSYAMPCDVQRLAEGKVTFSEEKKRAVEAFEQSFIEQVLNHTNGNITRAANLCGKERRAFGKLVKKYNIHKYVEVRSG